MNNVDIDLKIAQFMLEEESIRLGMERYENKSAYYEDKGLYSSKESSRVIMKDRIRLISLRLEEKEQEVTGLGANYNKMLPLVKIKGNYDIAAYVGFKALIDLILRNKESIVLTKIILYVAAILERESLFENFEEEQKAYFDTIKNDIKRKNIESIDSKLKLVNKYFKKFESEREEWSVNLSTHIGSKVLDAVLLVCSDLFERKIVRKGNKTYHIVEVSDKFYEWVKEFESNRSEMLPVFLPTVIPPMDFTSEKLGGYYTYRLQNAMPLIKTKSKRAKKAIKNKVPEEHIKAINKMQKTAYRVNEKVYEVLKEVYKLDLAIGIPNSQPIINKIPFPAKGKKETWTPEEEEAVRLWKVMRIELYGLENQRKGKLLSYVQMVKIIERMKGFKQFYFPYHCDFRGRIYCSASQFNPQGSDLSRGCLEYANGKRIGYIGIRELAINMANKYGISKCTREERLQWTLSNEEAIRMTVEDPIRNHHFWSKADKPYQFLAACFEWQGCNFGADPEFLTRIPCGVDGSCNGLQHYSAMLRDEIGAKATNLVNTELPNDIYEEVAFISQRKIREKVTTDPLIKIWQKEGVSRKCAKRPVMTKVYGATLQSCKQYIKEYMMDNEAFSHFDNREMFMSARALSEVLYKTIGEVVVGAEEAMAWLRKLPTETKDFIYWETPIGFPVFQHYSKGTSVNIRTQLCGEISVAVEDYMKKDRYNSNEQRNGIAPNFVHSLDATHLVMTVNSSNLDAYTMIHDEYGTYACDVPELKKALRQSFYDLYNNNDPLQQLAEQLGVECNIKKGNYKLEEILEAEYFYD